MKSKKNEPRKKSIKHSISSADQKLLLLEMLRYFDGVCRKNGINYSLIGGSLIGAIRHHGFIPWDDDIDVILMPNEYKKLMKVLKGNNHYSLFVPNNPKTYFYPFPKLVDNNTELQEIGYNKIDGYGVFLDIFSYHYVSNNQLRQRMQYLKQMVVKKMFTIFALGPVCDSSIAKRMLLFPTRILSLDYIQRLYQKVCDKQKPTKYVFSNWPRYSRKKETQRTEKVIDYIDVDFEGIKAMIFKNYDDVLRTTFDDYMKLPPKKDRVSYHNTIVVWKNNKERS